MASAAISNTPLAQKAPSEEPQESISAYYSLVFPNFTYFLQTLSVTIGRRCSPATSESSSQGDKTQVDVDLGPLKSVSRLHARIEYEEDEERFALVVVGRNGAWVDGVWSGSGSRVPLSERSQIQIASRTFHFVLPPPPPAPEDSPSPSDEQDEPARLRSPSVDIISHSPPSSLTSHSPPPPAPVPEAKPTAPPKPKVNSKKRKKTEPVPVPPPKPQRPEVMPAKPQLTYSIMCYRAINALGGKATLQDICGWMRDTFEWYKWNDEAGWENSVRHNLSSNRSFKKMERCAGERGKGFFWSIEEGSIPNFEEQEARLLHIQQQQANGSMSPAAGIKVTAGKRKDDRLGQLLKRGVKAGSGPLPPPLTSAPLVKKALLPPGSTVNGLSSPFTSVPLSHASSTSPPTVKVEPSSAVSLPPPPSAAPIIPSSSGISVLPLSAGDHKSVPVSDSKLTPTPDYKPALAQDYKPVPNPTPAQPPPSSALPSASDSAAAASTAAAQSTSFISSLPPSVCIPIIIGPVPSAASAHPPSGSSSAIPHMPTPPIVLHENTLILNPSVFSHLTSEQLKELEALGAQKALEILQSYIVRFLKERMRGDKDGARGRGRGRGRAKRGGAGLERGGRAPGPPGSSSPFTSAPLPLPNGAAVAQQASSTQMQGQVSTSPPTYRPTSTIPLIPMTITTTPRPSTTEIPISTPATAINYQDQAPKSPIIVVDDLDDDDGRAMKRRRLDDGGTAR
ncbi:hypothetical protein HWV62_15803 [Athelia sp. TMB]|nr:hypothetical protein HWV62_15803 [Athelia sp. TMB]